MSREQLANLVLKKVSISASQEELLNVIPGWEEVGAGLIDDTPSQESPSQCLQQRIFDVTGSSMSSDQDPSQKAVEWASPEGTPTPCYAGVGLENYHEPLDSDRSESPKTRLSWSFSHRGIPHLPEVDEPQLSVKILSIVNGEAVAHDGEQNASAVPSISADHVVDEECALRIITGDIKVAGDRRKGNAVTCGKSVPEVVEVDDSGTRSLLKKSNDDKFRDRSVLGNDPAPESISSKAAGDLDEGECRQRRPSDVVEANIREPASLPLLDQSPTNLKVLSHSKSSCALASRSEYGDLQNPPLPSEATQEKLKKLRKFCAADKPSRKRNTSDETVLDVVKQRSGGVKSTRNINASDLLSAAVLSGITLPPPISWNYFRST